MLFVSLADHLHEMSNPASILYKSIAARYRPVRVADGPITARYRFIKNAYWEAFFSGKIRKSFSNCRLLNILLSVESVNRGDQSQGIEQNNKSCDTVP